MPRLGLGVLAALTGLAIVAGTSEEARAQAPTLEQSGLLQSRMSSTVPGTTQSLFGPLPGGGGSLPGIQPGRDELLFGRLGPSAPRVPTSITMPGGAYEGPRRRQGVVAPQPLPPPRPPAYGRFELPSGPQNDGPPDGLTIDQAMDLYVHQNLELKAQYLEIPQARADVLTASLRANPIFYADSQLVPYGSFSQRRPSGPTQYDVNITHPIDFSHKRKARTIYAELVLRVTEHQYQDAVRQGLNNVYVAYVDVLAARQMVRFARVTVEGLGKVLDATETMFEKLTMTSAEVELIRSDREVAAIGLVDAEEGLRQASRVLAELLNIAPEHAESLQVRGTLEDIAPPPPPVDELIRMALQQRPDLAAYRLGAQAAKASLRLAQANQFSDAYLLFQPFTYQNNAPYGKEGVPSWALGITVPLPVYNRNQGNIERARINVDQSYVQQAWMERRVIGQVQQAASEYRTSRELAQRFRKQVGPPLLRHVEARLKLFQEGENTVFNYRDAERKYNDHVKAYLDAATRHRKAMLALNTMIGQRALP